MIAVYAVASGEPSTAGIAYSGVLKNHGLAASGPHDFVFSLVDQGGATLGCPDDMRSALAVTDGRFDAPGLFASCTLLSDILKANLHASVRITVDGQQLSPDQALCAVPYAIHAQYADNLAPSAANPTVVALTDGATIAVDAGLGGVFDVTLGGNRTLANPTNLVNGQTLVLRVKQDETGNRTLAFGSAWKGMRALTLVAGSVTIYTVVSDGTNVFMTGAYPPASAYGSCKQILAAGLSTGNGNYNITTPSGVATVYCDMANGGWTRVFQNTFQSDLSGVAFTRSGTACPSRVQTVVAGSGFWFGHGNGGNSLNVAGMGSVELLLALTSPPEITDATQIRETGTFFNNSGYDYSGTTARISSSPFVADGELASQVFDGTAYSWFNYYQCGSGATCSWDLTMTPPSGIVRAPYIRWGYQWGGPADCNEGNADGGLISNFAVYVK